MNCKSLLAATLVSIAAAASPAAAQTYLGATTLTSPTYNRVLGNGNSAPTGLSAVGTAVHYQSTGLTVSTSGSYSFLMTSVAPVNWDTFLTLYSTSFAPATPLTNALIANDDFTMIGNSGFTVNLTAGTSYFAVATGFSNTDVGTYSLVATGPGVVTFAGAASPVPEAATWALMIVGFGAVGGAMRRRSAVRTRVRFA